LFFIIVVCTDNLGNVLSIPKLIKKEESNFKSSPSIADTTKILTTLFAKFPTVKSKNKLENILKCYQLTLLTPIMLKLRSSIYSALPYKEVKGFWHVVIEIEKSRLIFSHKRKEQSNKHDLEDYFEFDWVVDFIFNKNYTDFDVEFSIMNWAFAPQTKLEWQSSLVQLIKPYVPKVVFYRKIWKKPINQFEIGRGILSLAKRLVLNMDGNTLYNGLLSKEDPDSPTKLIIILCTIFEGQEVTDKIKESINELSKNKSQEPAIMWDNFFFNKRNNKIKS